MTLSPLFETILRGTRNQLQARAVKAPLSALKRAANDAPPVRSFADALRSHSFSVIAEHKRRSPSGGNMNATNVAQAYAAYDVDWISAISVLTDVDHFNGRLEDLRSARAACAGKPILRKDFIVSEYQVYEARAHGADAVLLMAALHADEPTRLADLFALTRSLGMGALVEIGMGGDDPVKLAQIVPAGAEIWGVNSRKFEGSAETAEKSRREAAKTGNEPMISLSLHAQLRRLIPAGKLAIAESGIHTARDLRSAMDQGYSAALIGTAFLKGSRSIDDVVTEFGSVFAGRSTSKSDPAFRALAAE